MEPELIHVAEFAECAETGETYGVHPSVPQSTTEHRTLPGRTDLHNLALHRVAHSASSFESCLQCMGRSLSCYDRMGDRVLRETRHSEACLASCQTWFKGKANNRQRPPDITLRGTQTCRPPVRERPRKIVLVKVREACRNRATRPSSARKAEKESLRKFRLMETLDPRGVRPVVHSPWAPRGCLWLQ